MDKNTIIGLLLIAGILFTFTLVTEPEPEEKVSNTEQGGKDGLDKPTEETDLIVEQASVASPLINLDSVPEAVKLDSVRFKEYKDSVAIAEKIKIELGLSTQNKKNFGIFAPGSVVDTAHYTLENSKLIVRFSSKGGRIVDVKLKGFQSWKDYNAGGTDSIPMQLFDEETSTQSLRLVHNNDIVNTGDLYFEKQSSDGNELIFRTKTNDPGKYVEYTYTISENKYDIDYSISFIGLDADVEMGDVNLTWQMKGLCTEKLASDERMITTIMYRYFGEGRDYLSESGGDELLAEDWEGSMNWVAFKHKFFSSVLISKDGFKSGHLVKKELEGEKYTDNYAANLAIPAQSVSNYTFYFGPNDNDELASYDNEMEEIINLGWGIFRWVNKIMIQPVFNMLRGTGLGMGLIILLVTLFVKIIITPLTYKNYKSSAKMRVLKPEIDKINEKYVDKKDPMKKQQETMALYKATGVSPMAGCLPMIIQMPILLAVFRFFPSSIYLRHESFLWADDLSSFDSVWDFGFYIPMYGDHMSLFAILMAISTLFYTIMNGSQMNTSQPGMPNMKIIMYFFPVMMLVFFNNYSAGLSYYYLCGNLMNMAIMWAIKRYMIDEDKLRLQLAENKKKPKKQSAFQKRLEDMSKKQQQGKKKK
jgi:YidC/Oxa1 family membrane protein insertase